MRNLCKRIITGVFALVILFFSCVPSAYALPIVDVNVDLIEFGDWVHSNVNTVGNFFLSFINEDVCSRSPKDGGRHNFVEQRTQVNGKTGLYYICEYCGESAGEVLREKYNKHVADLPSPVYDSSGQLSFRLVVSRFDVTPNVYPVTHLSFTGGPSFYLDVGTNSVASSVDGYFEPFLAPVTGYYTLYFYFVSNESMRLNSFVGGASYRCYLSDPARDFSKSLYSPTSGVLFQCELGANTSYYIGDSIVKDTTRFTVSFDRSSFSVMSGYWELRCTPANLPGDSYNITTRPTTITGGNYGIVGDNGQITTVTVNNSIIDETNNTYYNPATGNSETVTNWTYDYSSRSYTITLESGDTITVTYGDENITIVEGDVNYTIYYVMENGCPGDDDDPVNSGDPANSDSPVNSDPPSGGDTHEHNWTVTNRIAPTCVIPGRIEYLCENCGQARVDVIPATGHIWQQKQFVPTAYDDDGNLIQRGYTVYECSVCGEQYKDELGIGPPSNSGSNSSGDSIWSKIGELLGTIFGGILGFFEAILSKLLDALISLGAMIIDKLGAVVEVVLSIFEEVPKLFGGFLDFLLALFPFLPDEIWLLLTFGIAAVVFIGIIKEIRR